MRKFRDLMEAKDTIVFAFGRFNPPTTGHEKLIQKTASVAGSNPYRIYPSFTTNPKKDPLPHALKVAYMRKMFSKYKRSIIADKDAKTAIMIAEKLYNEGFKNLVMVAGSDRIKEFSTLLNRYNDAPDKKGNQLFKFDSVEVISAGERDPDSEGVEGMSASKMRAAASNGDIDSFLQGVPSGFSDGKKLYRDVRKYMGIREEKDMGDMSDLEYIRDQYLTGKIWNVGDVVEANGDVGEVVRKGTNYLSFVSEDGKVHKAWLYEISWNKSPIVEDIEINEGPKTHFVYQRNKSIVHRGTEQSSKDWIKKSAKYFIHKGKDFDIYKGKSGTVQRSDILDWQHIDERNYAKEYANYQGKPEQIARRSSRNKARRIMGDKTKIGMDVGHKDNNPMNNDPSNLRNEDPSKNRKEPRLRGKELDEEWWNKVFAKISQMSHPKSYGKMVQDYAELMKQSEYRKHPSMAADKIAREYSGVSVREFIKYINKLVAKKILPQELKAEYEVEDNGIIVQERFVSRIIGRFTKPKSKSFTKLSRGEEITFKDLVNQIQERKLTDTELKRREEIAKDLSDADFKKRYGDRWKEVKMGVATKMAKKESLKT